MKKFLVISVYSVLTLSTLLVFRQVRNFDFTNYDDKYYVCENPHVLKGLSQDGIIWAFTGDAATSTWQPLVWLSLMFDCQLFGPDPGWLHLVNVLLHIANTLLLFAVLKKMTGSLWPSVRLLHRAEMQTRMPRRSKTKLYGSPLEKRKEQV